MKPSEATALEAVRTLLAYAGDDPNREGLQETPGRVLRSYAEFYAGYGEDPADHLGKVFGETEGYDQMVIVDNIQVESHCEHHMVPFTGTAAVAYVPNGRIVGLSKLAKVVRTYAKRLQVQERLTQQVANCIQKSLKPKGVAVMIRASHECMCSRGVHMPGATTTTSALTGCFRNDPSCRAEFLALIST